MRSDVAYLAFNRGIVSALGLARADIKRLALAAETMVNWMVRVLGAMALRCGFGFIGATKNNAACRQIPFIFSTSDTARLELTDSVLRVWVSDALITRLNVSTAVTNGTFDTDLSGWTDSDEGSAVSAWQAGGYMGLTGTGTAAAIRDQLVSVAGPDHGVEHALRIVINRGPVTLRVGTSQGDDSYITETDLATGTHSLAFTPTGDFWIRLFSLTERIKLVDSCTIETAGTMEIATPWTAAVLGKIRFDESADVIFVACEGFQQRKIERRATHSWSVVLYTAEDGPFRIENVGPITLTPSALTGNITVAASKSLFRSTQVGGIFSITSTGQTVTASISAQNTFSNSIRVTGVGTDRTFTIILAGVWVGTVTLQRSFDNAVWSDVSGKTWAANTTETYADGFDNQIVYYRLGIETGNYVSGTVAETLSIPAGSITGIFRITGFTSAILVGAEILTSLGGTTATDIWAEGAWSDYRGWPTSVAFHEGRLWWAGKNGVWASVSDAFDSFDPNTVGDSGPISRTIGSGPVDIINWILPMQRLLLGAQGAEFSCRSSSLDEPLTPTNFNLKPASTQGSAGVAAARIDSRGVYIQRGGTRVFELAIDPETYDYGSTHLTALCPEIGQPSIVRMAIQRQPDTRIHCVRSDGIVAVAVFDKVENVLCWMLVQTDGLIEDVVVLPSVSGTADDQVYYVVNRTINGATVRYQEKWSLESECAGGTLNKQADAFIVYQGVATAVISGLSHLEGRTVVVWGDGVYLGTAVVSGGQITVPGGGTVLNAIVGLPYTAQWKSAKLSQLVTQIGLGLTMKKRIPGLGLVLANVHAKGLRYGPDFNNLRDLPEIEAGKLVDPNTIRAQYDHPTFEFPGEWTTDARICLQAVAPKPCTVLAAVCEAEVHA